MPDIDIDKIKPGDTVRVRYQNTYSGAAMHPPVEYEGVVYTSQQSLWVGPAGIRNRDVTILEHIPAGPDWADALVVRDREPRLWAKVKDRYAIVAGGVAGGSTATAEDIDQMAGPITVVLDADGNPPRPEPEWLDADALDKLPPESLTICDDDGSWPLVKDYGGKWQHTGLVATGRLDSSDLAPARVLWAPEADR